MKRLVERFDGSTYGVLCRAFVQQFFSNESVTSDPQMRKAMAGVFAFLITPGLVLPLQMLFTFEAAARIFPQLLEPMTRVIASVFITFAMVTIGLLATIAWDRLSFDRRDAMVLGPLPLSGRTVIGAKLTALAVVMTGASIVINVMTAVPFAMIASSHKPLVAVARHFVGHMVATMMAAAFVFCALVTIRALLGMINRGRIVASVVQCTLVTAVLCFVLFMPTAVEIRSTPRRHQRPLVTVHQQTIPAWSPTNWFLAVYEDIRGTRAEAPVSEHATTTAVAVTLTSMFAAILTTVAGYRRQMRLALTPESSVAGVGGERVLRALARVIVGGNRIARATSDFMIATLARNRAQQAPIAINGAIGLTLAVIALSRGTTSLSSLLRLRTALVGAPLLLTYWIGIGLRASFFMPSELPAAWTFRMNAPPASRAYWSAVRASLLVLLVPVALALASLLIPALGWTVARWYLLVSAAAAVLLAETIALTIDFVPFTRAYPPGHAKLRTHWPLYLIGLLLFVYVPAHLASHAAGDAPALLQVVAWLLGTSVLLELAGRLRAHTWRLELPEEMREDSDIAVLDIGLAVARHLH